MMELSNFREFNQKTIPLIGGDPIKNLPIKISEAFSRRKDV